MQSKTAGVPASNIKQSGSNDIGNEIDGFLVKGFYIGMTEQQLRDYMGTIDTYSTTLMDCFDFKGFRSCDYDTWKLFEWKTEISVWLYKNRAFRISLTFVPDEFGGVKAGLVQKYGQPTSIETVTKSNRMGATFTGAELTWSNENQLMILSELGRKVDQSELLVMDYKISRQVREEAQRSEKYHM